ncbi:MAG: AAA domain-containing protein [Caldilineaceae bacterium SB0665_bin_21]|nr:AAA domain-containing protein [Caldilineaceae bacterium SB0665_bin_21]
MTNVYRMRLGSGGSWENQAIDENLAAIGFGIADDISDFKTREAIKFYLREKYHHLTPVQIGIWAFQVDLFTNTVKNGDFILIDLKTRSKIAVGMFTGESFQVADQEGVRRPVKWLCLNIDKHDLYPDLQRALTQQMTITEVRVPDAVARLRALADSGKDPGPNAYTVEDILNDGCFIDADKIRNMLQRLKNKNNLILQGPPGTGKTWLAKRLSWALVGRKDSNHVRAVQFHPNLSYEDFVRGMRPTSDGTLDLVDGPFLEIVDSAQKDSDGKYVLVIEEINRGNPAQILGEMLTLLEADKRNPESALELTYKRSGEQGIHLPPNLYVIGTMNIADRSLALVDLALRRRFAFIDLVPEIRERWKAWVMDQCGIDELVLSDVQDRMSNLNETIESDPKLGRQFQVGHSYVTPRPGTETDPGTWFRDVVESEIGPLLDEYWFDEPSKAQEERDRLLDGLDWR